tara:strand:- start:189 stop:785 length:597 start_codon:yes stop_codon:yes gene_type:complete
MARKTLLTEAEIRRFLKLASVGAINDAKISEYGGPVDELEEGPEEEELAAADEPVDVGGEVDDLDALGAEDDAELDDLGGEGEGAGEAEDLVSRIVDDLQQLAALADVDVDVEHEDEGDLGEPEADIEAPELGMEIPPEGGIEEEPVEAGGGSMRYENQDQVVAEVARRVVARLQQKQVKEETANAIAERIIKRLTKN